MRYLNLLLLFGILSCTGQKADPQVIISTSFGDLIFELSPEAPLHKENFISGIQNGIWDGATFNRLVHDFVIQGGCPDLEDGTIEADHWIKAEFHETLTHSFGALGMGRDANADKKSANCQFYIITNKEGIPRLDGDYTIFGKLIEGEEVLLALNQLANSEESQPVPFTISLSDK